MDEDSGARLTQAMAIDSTAFIEKLRRGRRQPEGCHSHVSQHSFRCCGIVRLLHCVAPVPNYMHHHFGER
jgi:hypothetical protein